MRPQVLVEVVPIFLMGMFSSMHYRNIISAGRRKADKNIKAEY